MDIRSMFDNNEKPLDNLVTDGGFTGIFRTIACVGDSLSSGEFESIDDDGKKHYHDYYDYSWGQYMARMAGCTVYNFSKGGMTAKRPFRACRYAFFQAARERIRRSSQNDAPFCPHFAF